MLQSDPPPGLPPSRDLPPKRPSHPGTDSRKSQTAAASPARPEISFCGLVSLPIFLGQSIIFLTPLSATAQRHQPSGSRGDRGKDLTFHHSAARLRLSGIRTRPLDWLILSGNPDFVLRSGSSVTLAPGASGLAFQSSHHLSHGQRTGGVPEHSLGTARASASNVAAFPTVDNLLQNAMQSMFHGPRRVPR